MDGVAFGGNEHKASTPKSSQASCVVGERMLHIEEAGHPHDGEVNYVPRMRDPNCRLFA